MSNFLASQLYNEDTFHNAFAKDLKNAKQEVIIESPYITRQRAIKSRSFAVMCLILLTP